MGWTGSETNIGSHRKVTFMNENCNNTCKSSDANNRRSKLPMRLSSLWQIIGSLSVINRPVQLDVF